MRKLLITQRVVRDAHGEIRDALDQRWSAFFLKAGFQCMPLPTNLDLLDAWLELEDLDGIVLSGGNDLNHIQADEINLLRDEFEFALIEKALKMQLPIWGVCRGMQVVATHFGSNLVPVEGHAGCSHRLVAGTSSRLRADLAVLAEVNSYHGYVVEQEPHEFQVNSRSEDGYLECMEHQRLPIFVQMWHPERDAPFRGDEIAFVKQFFKPRSSS